MMRRPRTSSQPTPPPPAPPPKAIPVETDPDLREAAIEMERKGRKRQGRSATLLDGALGGGSYAAPATQKNTMLG